MLRAYVLCQLTWYHPLQRASNVAAPASSKYNKPRMKPITEIALSDNDVEDPEVQNWPAHTKINTGALTKQNLYIRALCTKAIKLVEEELVFVEAWPELHKVQEYHVQVLTKAAKLLAKKGSEQEYTDIRTRVKKDPEFVKTIGRWVSHSTKGNSLLTNEDARSLIACRMRGVPYVSLPSTTLRCSSSV